MKAVGRHLHGVQRHVKWHVVPVISSAQRCGQCLIKPRGLPAQCPAQRVWQDREKTQRRHARHIDQSWRKKLFNARVQCALPSLPNPKGNSMGDVIHTQGRHHNIDGRWGKPFEVLKRTGSRRAGFRDQTPVEAEILGQLLG